MIVRVTLKRKKTGKHGTFGTLHVTDERICHTLEPPWKDNKKDISCIPTGEYMVTPHDSPTHMECFKVWGVTDREDILIHIGNWLKDTKGCILPGLERDDTMVKSSTLALEKLKELFPEGFLLTIVEKY